MRSQRDPERSGEVTGLGVDGTGWQKLEAWAVRGKLNNIYQRRRGMQKDMLRMGAEGQSKGHSGENEGNVSEMVDT